MNNKKEERSDLGMCHLSYNDGHDSQHQREPSQVKWSKNRTATPAQTEPSLERPRTKPAFLAQSQSNKC